MRRMSSEDTFSGIVLSMTMQDSFLVIGSHFNVYQIILEQSALFYIPARADEQFL